MKEKIFCIEILGEGAYFKHLCQSGFSGKDYHFAYNARTNSHVRAYRRFEDYLAERVDMHKTATVWALVANHYPADQLDAACFVKESAPAAVAAAPDPALPEASLEAESAEEEEEGDSDEEEALDGSEADSDASEGEPAKRKRGRPKKEASE